MKKLVLMLIAALSVALTGCSTFDSEPIEPDIIGTGNVQYEAKSDAFFVEIDSIQYTISNVAITNRNTGVLIREHQPIEGKLVTVFTSSRMTGFQAIIGKQSAEQIEALYHTNVLKFVLRIILIIVSAIFCMYFFRKFVESLINLKITIEASRNPTHPANEDSCFCVFDKNTKKLTGAGRHIRLPF